MHGPHRSRKHRNGLTAVRLVTAYICRIKGYRIANTLEVRVQTENSPAGLHICGQQATYLYFCFQICNYIAQLGRFFELQIG
jgi:hypothetical protein